MIVVVTVLEVKVSATTNIALFCLTMTAEAKKAHLLQLHGKTQVVGTGFHIGARGIDVTQDTANEGLQSGIDIVEEKLPQVVGLIGNDFLDHGVYALLALVDDVLDIGFAVIGLDNGKDGTGQHLAQVPQR